MARPTLFGEPLSQAERDQRYRLRKRGIDVPMPEPTPEERLKIAQREIWGLQRTNGRLRSEASARMANDYQLTAPLYMEIKRLKGLLEQHGINPEPWKKKP